MSLLGNQYEKRLTKLALVFLIHCFYLLNSFSVFVVYIMNSSHPINRSPDFSCSLCTTGVVRLHINDWLEVSFCLPHKIHRIGGNYIHPEALEQSLKAIRFVICFDL